ncbi:MAG: hypothetical protein V4543_04310 [Bacteroidota bacterium]
MKKFIYLIALSLFFLPVIHYRVDSGAVYSLSLIDLATLNQEASRFMLLIQRIDADYLHLDIMESGIQYAFLLLWLYPVAGFFALISSFSSYHTHENQISDNMAFAIGILIIFTMGLTLAIRFLTDQDQISALNLMGAGGYMMPAVLLLLIWGSKVPETAKD